MDCPAIEKQITEWLREKAAKAGSKGLVLGLSGGIDSALVGALAVKAAGENCLGLIMPCGSHPLDSEHAVLAAERFGIKNRVIDLTSAHRCLLDELRRSSGSEAPRLAAANLKPRLRMTSMYYCANELNYLVLGTGNRSEWYVGYSTKYGDGGVDVQPILGLLKSQVVELSQHLGVPEEIISKPPTAGLWQGQTDEGEMGFTYAQLDRYISTGQAEEAVRERIEGMHVRSRHKFAVPESPIDPKEGIALA